MMSTKGELLAIETCGANMRRAYRLSNDGKHVYMVSKETRWLSLSNFFMNVFLPHGYPESVSEDYLQYQIWDSVQAFASSINGSISTHALLKGVGVGDNSASTLAATITWITRDGTSMIGRIIFSWLQSIKLDSECKKWRLIADVLNDVALFLDLMSPHFSHYYGFIICVSGLFKAIVGVAGGATRAALTQHQARKNNMADVSAKDGSQETLVNLGALICSLVIIPFVTQSQMLIWMLYVTMTIVHLGANYFAIKSVKMETFNRARFTLCFDSYLSSSMTDVLSPDVANSRESLSIFPSYELVTIKIGSSLHDATKYESFEKCQELINLLEKRDYLLNVVKKSKKFEVHICLSKNASLHVQLKSMFHAIAVKHLLLNKQGYLERIYRESFIQGDRNTSIVKFTKHLTDVHFEDFIQKCVNCGWKKNIVLFNTELWRVDCHSM